MNMMGKENPAALSWRPSSTPEVSPSCISTTRHSASLAAAAARKSLADPNVSVRYPEAYNSDATALLTSGLFSTTAITRRFAVIRMARQTRAAAGLIPRRHEPAKYAGRGLSYAEALGPVL